MAIIITIGTNQLTCANNVSTNSSRFGQLPLLGAVLSVVVCW